MSSLPCPLHGWTRIRTTRPPRVPRPHHGVPLAAVVGGLCLLAAGQARALDPSLANEAQASPIHLEWTQSAGNPSLATAPALYGPATVQGNSTQTMLWAGRGRVAVGLGVEQRWAAPPGYPATARLVGERNGQWLFGVSLQTSLQTRLSWQVPASYGYGSQAGWPASEPVDGQRAARLSLDWGHPDPYKGLLRGSLRFELARDTTLSIKPRGGNWSLALSSKW